MPDPLSPTNLVDELAEEFARRWRDGERPSVEEYAARFPELADTLRGVLPAVVLMEQLKPRCRDTGGTNVPPPCPGRPPERVGEYRIVREIGRGGMGVVYEADQETLGRRVAIKMLLGHLPANEQVRARFLREAQAAARLHHTNIVPVFGVGEREGQCFYVMQLINGRGLDQILQETAAARGAMPAALDTDRTLPSGRPATRDVATMGDPAPHPALAGLAPRAFCRAIARIGVQVADALAYAHTQGVLHRDVKPSNLLLDDQGAVWVTDFGVAKVIEGADLTQSGEFVGTMKYMPPERFAGQSDSRGDVYSLGVTLYELLTFRSAFPDTTPHHLIQLITQRTPTPPRKLNRDIPTDLETIVLKAAARDPAQRYQTAGELAEDLRRFLYDRPILARRTGPVGHLWRLCRRNPMLATVTATALLLMVAVTVVSMAAYVQTAAANRETELALGAEKAEREHAENTATLALGALNRMYDHFAPTRLVVLPPTANEAGVELPPQPAALPPDVVPLLEDLLRTYEQIAHASGKFPRLRAQVAEANHRIGDLRRRLGRYQDAATAYRTAIDLYTQLLSGPEGNASRVKLARAYNELGRTLRSLQQFDEMVQMHERAIQTLEEAPKAFTDRPECRFELACTYYALGQRDMFLSPHGPGPDRPPPHGPGPDRPPSKKAGHGPLKGDKRRPPPEGPGQPPGPPPEGRGDHPARRAIVLLKRLVREFPSAPEYRHLLACCYRDLPPDPPGWGPPATAQPDLAVELLRQLVADFPKVPDYRFDLCETLGRPGPPGPPGKTNGGGQSRKRLEEAIARSEELVAHYPHIPEYTAAHAQYLDRLGMLALREGQIDEAVTRHRKAVVVQVKLVKQNPDVVAYRLWLGLMERSLGRALGTRGDLKEARALLEGATARVEALWQKDPRLGGVRPFLGMAYRDLAQVLEQCNEPALAAAARRKADEFGNGYGPGPRGPRG